MPSSSKFEIISITGREDMKDYTHRRIFLLSFSFRLRFHQIQGKMRADFVDGVVRSVSSNPGLSTGQSQRLRILDETFTVITMRPSNQEYK